jgi:hypothetical protein
MYRSPYEAIDVARLLGTRYATAVSPSGGALSSQFAEVLHSAMFVGVVPFRASDVSQFQVPSAAKQETAPAAATAKRPNKNPLPNEPVFLMVMLSYRTSLSRTEPTPNQPGGLHIQTGFYT